MRGTGDLEGAVNTYNLPKKTAAEKRAERRRLKRPAASVRTRRPKRVKYVVAENGTVDQEPLQNQEPLQS